MVEGIGDDSMAGHWFMLTASFSSGWSDERKKIEWWSLFLFCVILLACRGLSRLFN